MVEAVWETEVAELGSSSRARAKVGMHAIRSGSAEAGASESFRAMLATIVVVVVVENECIPSVITNPKEKETKRTRVIYLSFHVETIYIVSCS